MKIAAVSNTITDQSLGSGKTVVAWCQGLRDLGHEVQIFSPTSFYKQWPMGKGKRFKIRFDAIKLKPTLLERNYDLIEFYGGEFGHLISQLSAIPRQNRPLLIAHTNGLELLERSTRQSAIASNRTNILNQLFSGFIESKLATWDEWAFSKVDGFAALCKADIDYLVKNQIQPVERCALVATGIDDTFLNSDWQHEKRNWLISFGSWIDRKGKNSIINVTSNLLLNNPQLEFHVLGAASAARTIRDSFDPLLSQRIVVHPRLSTEGLVKILSHSKVLLFPSLYEGFGMAIAEAMACGCAVVVTPTGFGLDIRSGIDGYVCDFNDTNTMQKCCQVLLNDDSLRTQITLAARKRVAELCWSRQAAQLEAIYLHWINTY